MIYAKEIDDYLEYYEKNQKLFNKERKLLIENIVKPTLKRDDIFFDADTYQRFLKYTSRWYYPLFPYQKFISAFLFMYKDDVPIFRTFFIEMGRGNGKDGFIAPLVDFLSSQYYRVNNYNIDIVANSEDQAEDTYKVIYEMKEANKGVMFKHFYWNKEECFNRRTRSRIKYHTANASTKDGKKSGLVVFNEYHAYLNYDNINVFQSGLGKTKHSRMIIITTNGYVREGPLDETEEICNKVLNGEENVLRYFPFICRMDSIDEVDNEDLWEKANPSIKFLPDLFEAIKMDYYEQKQFPSKRPEFLVKRMNIPSRDEAETITSWENILKASYSDITKKIPRNIPNIDRKAAVIGIDYASLNDFASAGFIIKNGSEIIWRQKTWICAKGRFFDDIKFPFKNKGIQGFEDFEIVNENSISEDLIVDWVISQMKILNVKKIILDNYRFQLLRKAFEKYGLTVETKQNPNGLIRMIRYPASIAAIIAPKIELYFSNGNLNIGDSAIMRWAINNTCVKTKKDGNKTYEKIEPKLRKNDPFMAFICAMSGEDLLDEQEIYVYI